MRFLLSLPILLLVSCSSPSWTVSNETPQGFDLQAYYGEYAFVPGLPTSRANSKNYFRTAAKEAAKERGKTVAAVALLTVQYSRNIATGRDNADMEGRVRYGPEPFSGPVFTDTAD